MIEVILLAEIWFWYIGLNILLTPIIFTKTIYESMIRRSYESHFYWMLYEAIKRLLALSLLYWLIWGQK